MRCDRLLYPNATILLHSLFVTLCLYCVVSHLLHPTFPYHHLQTTVQDKQLVDNVLKHATTHNRVIEEEACWRQILQQRKQRASLESGSESGSDRWSSRHRLSNERHHSGSPVSEASWKNSSQRSANSGKIATSEKQQALDAYERELRHQAKREIELAASQKLPGVSVPNVTMNDRWGHDGWEALQNSNAREPTPAYRPRIQPASYRLAPLVSRTIENPIRSESISSDLSHRSSSAPTKKSKRHRKSKKRKRRRRGDADSDTDDSRSRTWSRSVSSDASEDDDEDGGGDTGDKRSKKKKSRKKRRKEKKRRSKRYSKRRGRKSRRRRRYDSSSCSRSSSRSRSTRSRSSRSRTRRTTSFSSYTSAGSRSRRSSCSCSCCDSRSGSFSTSRSRSGSNSRSSSSSRSRSRSGGRRSRSRSLSASSFDSQRAANARRAVQPSREPSAESKALPRELTDDGRLSERTANTHGRLDNGSPIQPLNECDIPLPDGVCQGPASVSPAQCTEPGVVRDGGVGFESPGVASSSSWLPRKPVSPTSSSRSPNVAELQSPREKVPLPRDPIQSGELDDLYDPVLAVSDTPSHSPKSSEVGRAGHSDIDACEIVDQDSDISVEITGDTAGAPPTKASPPISHQRRADAIGNTAQQLMVCLSPFSIPLPSPKRDKPTRAAVDLDSREEEALVVRLSDIVPPPMPRNVEGKPKQQHQPKTLTIDCNGTVEEVPLDSICVPPTPPSSTREVSIGNPTQPPSFPGAAHKHPHDKRSCSRYDSLSSDRSTSLLLTKYDGRTMSTSEDRPGGVQSREYAALEGRLKRQSGGYSPKSSSEMSASPGVAARQRSKRNARYSGLQDDGDQRETGGYPADSSASSFQPQPQQQPNQATVELSILADNTSKLRRRKSREEQPVDQVVSSEPVAQTAERVVMLPPAIKETPPSVGDVRQHSRVVSNTRYESQEEGEILSPFEETTFKRRKRKHGKYHSNQREEPPAFAMTISPFKLPSRQFLARKKQHSEPYVEVRQPSPTPVPPVKPKKKSRDKQRLNKADRAPSDEPTHESDRRERGRRDRSRRDRHAVAPMDLPVAPCSLAEQPIEKVSRWQEHGAAPHPSTAHSRSVAQPAVTSSLGRAVVPSLAPPSKQQLQERDSSTEPKVSTTKTKPASVGNEHIAANSHQTSVSSRKTKNKKEKKAKRKEKRKHSPEVPAEPLPETVSSRKRTKRKQQIRFTEALEAFTQQLLDTKRALLPFAKLSQIAYGAAAMTAPEYQGKRTSRKHPPLPLSSYPIPETYLPQAKPISKKRHKREFTLSAEHSLVSDPHIPDEQVHSYLEEKLLNAGKDHHRHTAQQVQQPDRSVKQRQQDSDCSTSDTTSDSESSTSSSNSSSDGDSSTNSSDSGDEQQTVAPAPLPASQKHQHHHQPVTSYVNGTTHGHRRPGVQEPKVSLTQPHDSEGRHQKKQKQPSLKDEVNSSRRHMENQTWIRTSTASHQSLSARKRPPPSTGSSSESSDSSVGISSLQSDEEIAWKKPSS